MTNYNYIFKTLRPALLLMGAALLLVTAPDATASPERNILTHQRLANQIAEAGIGWHELDITVRQGRAEINGTVASEAARNKVLEIARNNPGVSELKSDIRVDRSRDGSSLPLAQEIDRRVASESQLSGYSLTISVTDNVATLTGSARTQSDRARIEQLAASTPGITSVVNKLELPAAPTDVALERRLVEALSGEPQVSQGGINISVREGVAYFEGSASNHRDLDRILSSALMVDGVKGVRSEVRIVR